MDKMGKTVLVVDDAPTIRQLVSFTLKDEGYEVITAANGKEALEKLNGGAVSLVLTDLNMPEMDGISFIKGLRGRSNHRFTPIIVLSTESQERKKQEAAEAGASCWIVKPFTPDALVELVNKFAR